MNVPASKESRLNDGHSLDMAKEGINNDVENTHAGEPPRVLKRKLVLVTVPH